jgi:hypothetical protein
MNRDIEIEAIRARVMAQADALGERGWMDIAVPRAFRPSGILRVPRAPFELWAVARSNGDHLVSPWTPVSPPGLKVAGDDPYHSDWMIGAGLDPLDMRHDGNNPHHEALAAAAERANADVQKRLLGFDCAVLLQGPDIRGRVHIPADPSDLPEGLDEDGLPPVVIVKNAGPDWLEAAMRAFALGGAVIVERGGEMAHLVTALRPEGKGPIVRKEKAKTLYPDGSVLDVMPSIGRIALAEDERIYRAKLAAASPRHPFPVPETIPRHDPPPADPGFGIVARDPERKHPALEARTVEPAYSLDGARHSIRASFHYDDMRPRSLLFGPPKYLVVHAHDRERPDSPVMTFYSRLREWRDGEAANACAEVLHRVDPDSRNSADRFLERARVEDREERARAKAKWMALSADELERLIRQAGIDENEFSLDWENGEVENYEWRAAERTYERAFEVLSEVVAERGLPIDVDALRIDLVRREDRHREDTERRERQQKTFEEHMNWSTSRP